MNSRLQHGATQPIRDEAVATSSQEGARQTVRKSIRKNNAKEVRFETVNNAEAVSGNTAVGEISIMEQLRMDMEQLKKDNNTMQRQLLDQQLELIKATNESHTLKTTKE